jgi:N-acetylglucosamine-6-sulfatase
MVPVAALLATLAQALMPVSGTSQAQPARPNVILIVTDDQRVGTLRYMPDVRDQLARQGISFTDAYVVNPTCCPSRASILTGNYSHTTSVYLNDPRQAYGGFPAFDDTITIATMLHDAGYRTGLFGKYLNGYRSEYVPPGWDRWFATVGRGGYYDYVASSDGNLIPFGHDPPDYGTDVLRDEVVSFIRSTNPSTPLFAYVAPHAPHKPATPAPGDGRLFASLAPFRPQSYDEKDVSDKPTHMQAMRRLDEATAAKIDRFRRAQIRALQAVDRAVADIVAELDASGRLSNTLIVFTSDNGMLWGEHRLDGKGVIYEEAIRVPFLLRYDALTDQAREDDRLVLNIDLTPTFAEAAGIPPPPADGQSLLPLLGPPGAEWRDAFLIEHLRAGGHERLAPTFCAVHTSRYVLARYGTGEQELYDLDRDPMEMVNRSGGGRYTAIQAALLDELRSLCDPVPPGYAF